MATKTKSLTSGRTATHIQAAQKNKETDGWEWELNTKIILGKHKDVLNHKKMLSQGDDQTTLSR